MAVANRFTNIQPARYNPRSLQELMIAPQYMRQQHDAVEEGYAATNAAIGQVDPLSVHSEIAKMEQDKLYNQITKQADILSTEGFTPSAKSNFLKINKDYQQAMGPSGTLGKIQAAKTAYLANQKAHIDAAVKAGFSPQNAQLNWEEHAAKYADEFKKTGAVTPIGALGNPNYVNGVEMAMNLFDKAGFSKTDLGGGMLSRIITTDERGTYVLNTSNQIVTKDNINQLKAAVDWMNNTIANPNSDLRKSMAYERKTPQDLLKEIGGLAKVYVDTENTSKNTATISNFKINENINGNNLTYEGTEAKGVEVKRENLTNKLDTILSGGLILTNNPIPNTTIIGRPLYGEGDQTKATIENSLDDKQKEEFNSIFRALQRNNSELENVSPNSEQAITFVRNHLKNSANIVRRDFINTTDLTKTYGNNTVGIKSTNKSEMLSGITSNAALRTYAVDGKIIPFNKLDEGIKQAIAGMGDGLIEFSGTYDKKNFLSSEYIADTKDVGGDYKNMLVEPHKLVYTDSKGNKKDVLVSRAVPELNDPSYRAAGVFNDIYQTTMANAGGAYIFPDFNNFEITFQRPQYEQQIDPTTGEEIFVQTSGNGFKIKGMSKLYSESELEEFVITEKLRELTHGRRKSN